MSRLGRDEHPASPASPLASLGATREFAWENELRGVAQNIPRTLNNQICLLFVARTSRYTGRRALDAVHMDMANALEDFKRLYGPDFSHLLPTKSRLKALFAAARPHASRERSGAGFWHKFVELDYRDTDGVYLLFTMGSGSKLDEHLRQPSLDRLYQVVRRIQPGAAWAKHIYRMGRHPWAFGPAVTELNFMGSYLGDGEKGLRLMESMESVLLFFEATKGESEALVMGPRTRKGMRAGTRTEMVDGVAQVAAPSPVPPGLARLRLRYKASEGASVLVFDTPESLPAPEAVAYGYPEAVDSLGRPVDQVENVRWALSQFGLRPKAEIGRELVRRGFSTARLREVGGPAATATNPITATNSILAQLTFYRTGVLKVRLGEPYGEIEVSGCVPDGGWATAGRIDEIEAWQQHGRDLEATRATTTFGGTRVTINGAPGRLSVYRHDGLEEGQMAFRVHRAVSGGPVLYGAVIPHSLLAEALVDGIANAGDKALLMVPRQVIVPTALSARLTGLDGRRASAEANKAAIADQLEEVDSAGRRIISGSLLRAKNDRYNKLQAEVDEIEREAAQVRAEIAELESEQRRNQAPALADRLLKMVATLSDPWCVDHRYTWRRALQDVTVTTRERRECQLRGPVVSIEGALRVGSQQREVLIPFAASLDTLEVVLDDKVHQVIEEMREGIPAHRTGVPMRYAVQRRVANALGYDSKKFAIALCTDPRVLRLAMARCHPLPGEDNSDEAVAERFGEPTSLVGVLGELWAPGAKGFTQWWLPGAPTLRALYLSAALGAGVADERDVVGPVCTSHESLMNAVRRRGLVSEWQRAGARWTLRPCARCGSTALAVALIREVTGSLCVSCWHDRSGVEWPLVPYAHLVDGLAAYQNAGLVPRVAPPDPLIRSHDERADQREAPCV